MDHRKPAVANIDPDRSRRIAFVGTSCSVGWLGSTEGSPQQDGASTFRAQIAAITVM
jgi:hypothetical protein